jgi:hypothetical protein
MICDPNDPATDGAWTSASDCDLGTDVNKFADNTGSANFTAAQSVQMFRRASPSNEFACNAPGDPPVDGMNNYTNCRLVAMDVTGDVHPSRFASITLTLSPPSGVLNPPPVTPEVPYAVILPIGALVVGGGFVLIGRRRGRWGTRPVRGG